MNFHNFVTKSLKKYVREPSDLNLVNETVSGYIMDYARWEMMNDIRHNFTYKYTLEPKPKRKLFYKFVRRFKK